MARRPHDPRTRYVIRLTAPGDEILYWNNSMGWVDFESADVFTPAERRRLNLPMQGEWVPR